MSRNYPYLNAEVPSKENVLEKTPNRATKELLQKMEADGVENTLDRFEKQQPQCNFGMCGTCCQRCLWGPCRVGPPGSKREKGICGADRDLIVAGNLLRSMAAGCTAHGTHALEIMDTISTALSEENSLYELLGRQRVQELAERFQLREEEFEKKAAKVAEILRGSINGCHPGIEKLIRSYAPPEQLAVWEELGILPRSAMEEVFEALHITTLGSCSDWKQVLKQEMRTALAYCYGTLFPASLGQEMLFGIPEPTSTPVEVNYGILNKESVNIIIHGHSPALAEAVVSTAKSTWAKELAQKAGAAKINLVGACCTGKALLSRHGIPSVGNIMGMELIMATSAVDALVLDMQCAIPGLQEVSKCYGGEIITTCESNRFADARHIPFSPSAAAERAEDIIRAAIDNFRKRGDKEVYIPQEKTSALAGWEQESLLSALGGENNLVKYLKEGDIKAIVSIGGCNSPKVPYEFNHVELARKLIGYGALVLTTGCASYGLLNAGLASPEAAELSSPGLQKVCRKHGIPPVLPVGACTDNARLVELYARIAGAASRKVREMPFCHSGPAPGSEKNIGQGLTFLLHGVSVHQGFAGGIPVPLPRPAKDRQYADEMELDASSVARYFAEGAYEKLGARVYLEPYPNLAAKTMQMHLHRQRLSMGWKS